MLEEPEQLTLAGLDVEVLPTPAKRRLTSAEPTVEQLAFGAGEKSLVRADDGLLARVVHRHSARKAYYVRRYAEIVGMAMTPHWPQIWWAELFAGPGRLMEVESGRFLPGSPLEALTVTNRFTGYVFADLSETCVDALRERTAGHRDVHVLHGDANSAELLDRIAAIVPRNALVIIYADPEGLDLHFDTLRYFADRYRHLDLLVNVPIAGVVRYLAAGGEARAVPVLGHADPAALLREARGRRFGPDVRVWYQRQLEALGYEHFRVETILLEEKNVPIYDLLLASRHERAAALFDAACEIRPDGQRSLFASS